MQASASQTRGPHGPIAACISLSWSGGGRVELDLGCYLFHLIVDLFEQRVHLALLELHVEVQRLGHLHYVTSATPEPGCWVGEVCVRHSSQRHVASRPGGAHSPCGSMPAVSATPMRRRATPEHSESSTWQPCSARSACAQTRIPSARELRKVTSRRSINTDEVSTWRQLSSAESKHASAVSSTSPTSLNTTTSPVVATVTENRSS